MGEEAKQVSTESAGTALPEMAAHCSKTVSDRIADAQHVDHQVMDFYDLMKIEPRLGPLAMEISAIKAGKRFCANEVWFEDYKDRMTELVGWGADRPEVQTMQAYDVAYAYLYRLLPDCHGCGCPSIR